MGLTLFMYYFATGCVALAALVAYRRWRPGDEPRNVFERDKPTSLKMRLANVVLIPLAIVFFFVPLWPWILSIEFNFPWYKFKFWTDKAAREVPWTLADEPAFAVSKSDLLERFSRSEIEDHERVADPLHSVPSEPFGHLHGVWRTFINGLEPEWEVWSFQSRWKTPYLDYQMQGYVARHGEKIGPHCLTSKKSMRVV